MKATDIRVGGKYTVRLSTGRLVTMQVDSTHLRDNFRGQDRRVYFCTQVDSGRQVTIRSAAKFRGIAE